MFARLVSAQVKVGKLDEVIRIWKEEDIPLMGSVRGYQGAYLLTNRKTGNAISMTLWNTEEDAIADERSALHSRQLDMFKGLMTGEPVAHRYEVSAKDNI
jgi:heme-degrading monooxygenase HmoA